MALFDMPNRLAVATANLRQKAEAGDVTVDDVAPFDAFVDELRRCLDQHIEPDPAPE